MEEILASIRRIISDEVASDPVPSTRNDPPARSGREGSARDGGSREASARDTSAGRAAAPGREPSGNATLRPASPAPLRPAAAAPSSATLSYAPAPYRERPEAPVDYAPRGRAPAADPFAARPLSLSAASSVYSGGSAARALETPMPSRPASETRPPEPRRAEARLFPDSRPLPDHRPLPDLRALPEPRARLEPRLVEPRAVEPRAVEPRLVAPRASAASRPSAVPMAGPSAIKPSAAAPSAAGAPVARPMMARPQAPLDSDLDKPLAAALLDLALVEQAVQAELANAVIAAPAAGEGSASGIASADVKVAGKVPAGGEIRSAQPGDVATAARGEIGHARMPVPAAPSWLPEPDATAAPGTIAPVMAEAATADAPEDTATVAPAEAKPVAETAEMPRPPHDVPAASLSAASLPAEEPVKAPVRDGTGGTTAARAETAPDAPSVAAPMRPDFRSLDPRPPEPRPLDARLAESRLAETRLSESRLVMGSRLGSAPEAGEPERERLVSAPASSAVSAAFGSLHRTVNANPRTVEDLVAAALRPMLKAWLDENLPAMVERLVRAEIERVARQGQ
ncbi:DUF2497 domain-containing protein [Ancylobacter dichloromethanicus]|nr:DUF2497 domain-containing protein [Ancylobacter dichloromethanicus]